MGVNISVNYCTEQYFNETIMTGFPPKEDRKAKETSMFLTRYFRYETQTWIAFLLSYGGSHYVMHIWISFLGLLLISTFCSFVCYWLHKEEGDSCQVSGILTWYFNRFPFLFLRLLVLCLHGSVYRKCSSQRWQHTRESQTKRLEIRDVLFRVPKSFLSSLHPMHLFTKNNSMEGRKNWTFEGKYFKKRYMNIYIILMKIRYSNHANRKVSQIWSGPSFFEMALSFLFRVFPIPARI